MDNPRVSKLADFFERVLWTAIQAAAGAGAVVLSTGVSWQDGLKFVGVATLAAVLKNIIGQNTGQDDTGAIMPGGAIEPPPQS